jgi:hypothetical protein
MSMQLKNRARLSLETLESRVNPAAFNFFGVGDTLIITQVGGSTGTSLDISDDPATNTITLNDVTVSTISLSTSGFNNLRLNLLSGDSTIINYTQVSNRTGNLDLSVANTLPRTLNLSAVGAIGGNLTVNASTAPLTINEVGGPLVIGGNATFNGGSNGNDVLNLSGVGGTTIGGNLTINRFNNVDLNTDSIGGNFLYNAFGEGTNNTVDLVGTTVGGFFNYVGGNGTDGIVLGAATTVGGSATINFGNSVGGISSFDLLATGVIGGSLSVIGSNLGTDDIDLEGFVGGNVLLNLGGGANDVDTVAATTVFGGQSFNYIGGAGVDDVTYAVSAASNRLRVTAQLGAGADFFRFLGNLQAPSFAFIDFGAGVDTVTGVINFPFTFLNLP